MARSFIDPSLVALATEPAAPPWNWNPGQTFVTSFMLAQENQRAQQKAAQEAELAAILFPYKQQTAALELEKLQQEVERSTLLTKKLREGRQVAHRGIMRGLQNPTPTNQNTSPQGKGLFSSLTAQTDSQTPLPEEDKDIVVLE